MKIGLCEVRMEMEELNSILDASGKFPAKVKSVRIVGDRSKDEMHYTVICEGKE